MDRLGVGTVGIEADEFIDLLDSQFDTVANVEAAKITAVTTSFVVGGYYSVGDGGAGQYIRAPSAGAGPGKIQSADGQWWILAPADSVNVIQFGAYMNGNGAGGGTNDATAIQAAITFAKTTTGNVTFPKNAIALCNSGLTIDTSLVAVNVNGASIDFSNMTTGNAITIVNAGGDSNANVLHPVSNFAFIGPGILVTGVCAVYIASSNPSTTALYGSTFRDGSFFNFAEDFTLGGGSFGTLADRCTFTQAIPGSTVPLPTTYSINITTTDPNSVERNTFLSCQWIDRPLIINQSSNVADTYFNDCSWDDASGERLATITGGMVFFNGHMELDGNLTQGDLDNQVYVRTGANCGFIFQTGFFVLSVARQNFSPFYVDPTVTNGGLMVSGEVVLNAITGQQVPLIEGAVGANNLQTFGRAVISPNVSYFSGAAGVRWGQAASMLAYGNMESSNSLSDWTRTGTVALSTAEAHTGLQSMLLTGNASAKRNFPALGGQVFGGDIWYRTSGLNASGGTLAITAFALDNGGNILADAGIVGTMADAAVWTLGTYLLIAPPGTVNFSLQITVTGSTGSPLVYIDDVSAN